ncbi:MAG TPA: hypothetical protein VEC99_09910 [Clostridia bacterium]|nr:hypothetical protein [Clostridia bacterium]
MVTPLITVKNAFATGEPLLRKAIRHFSLLSSGSVLVGASGGKDSTYLALLLRNMGFDVRCLVVDMGYPGFDAAKVADNLRCLGLPADVSNLRREMEAGAFSPDQMKTLAANFAELDSESCVTPCGACSRNKRLALLSFALQKGFSQVALGHHQDDFLVTLLKDYFAHCYYRVCGRYNWEQFAAFIGEAVIDEGDLASMCAARQAATMSVALQLHPKVSLFRPMIFIPEDEIIASRDALAMPTVSSGCSHSVFTMRTSPPTKRELVHADLKRRLRNDPELAKRLVPLMLSTLTSEGYPIATPRNERRAALPGFD